jgi:hypothetical protein
MAPDPLPSAQLCHTQALAHVGEYSQAMHAWEFNTLAAPPIKTIVALRHLHPLAKVDLIPFVNDFHLETDLGLDIETFIFVLTHSAIWCMNFCDIVLSLMTLFITLKFFEICGHIAYGHVPPSISHLFVAS